MTAQEAISVTDQVIVMRKVKQNRINISNTGHSLVEPSKQRSHNTDLKQQNHQKAQQKETDDPYLGI